MDNEKLQNFKFRHEDHKGLVVVSGEINGESEIPLLDDLKFKAVIALLHSIDRKNFGGKEDLFETYIAEITETIAEMKKFDQFQGERRG